MNNAHDANLPQQDSGNETEPNIEGRLDDLELDFYKHMVQQHNPNPEVSEPLKEEQ